MGTVKNTTNQRNPIGWKWLQFILCVALIPVPSHADVPLYAEQPIVPIAHSLEFFPGIGFAGDFVVADIQADSVIFAATSFQGNSRYIHQSAGFNHAILLSLPLAATAPEPPATELLLPYTIAGTTSPFAFVTTTATDQPQLWTFDDGEITLIVGADTPVPSTQGTFFHTIKNPVFDGRTLTFFGSAGAPPLSSQSGIYQVTLSEIVSLVDESLLELPEPQFAYANERLLFLGRSANMDALYEQTPATGIRTLLQEGTRIADRPESITAFLSPPSADGTIAIGARLSSGEEVILSLPGQEPQILVKPQDLVEDGSRIEHITPRSIRVTEGRVYFEAQTDDQHQGILVLKDGRLSTVVKTSQSLLGDSPPDQITLLDAEGDQIVVKAQTTGIISLHASLSHPEIPVIYGYPQQPVIASPNESVTLEVQTAGREPLSYLWRKDGIPLSDSNHPNLTLESLTADDAGTYHVTVNNDAGTHTVPIALQIATAPILTGTLTPQSLLIGESILLTMTAQGAAPLSFQWFQNGLPLENQSSEILWIESADVSHTGTYHVRVENDLGAIESQAVAIQVTPPPPNPRYELGQFNPIATLGQALPSFPDKGPVIAWQGFPAGRHLVLVAQFQETPVEQELLLVEPNGAMTALVTTKELTTAFGETFGATFDKLLHPTWDSTAKTVTFVGTITGVPVGIFRYENGSLTLIIDLDSPLPAPPLQSLRAFHTVATRYGNTHFTATLLRTETNGIYLATKEGIERLVDETIPLPYGFGNGSDAAFLARTSQHLLFQQQRPTVPPDIGLFRRHEDATIDLLAQTGDVVSGLEGGFHSVIHAEATPQRFFALIWNTTFQRHLIGHNGTTFRALAGPGHALDADTQIASLNHAPIHFENGRLYFSAEIAPPNGGSPTRPAILYWDESGLNTVIHSEHLEGQRFTTLDIVHATNDNLFIEANLQRGGATLFTNYSPFHQTHQTLGYQRDQDYLHFEIPEEFQLEASDPAQPLRWYPIAGTGTVSIAPDHSARFFRLQKF